MNYFKKGQWVKVASSNSNENYSFFKGKKLKIVKVATNKYEHPGYDETMDGMQLYDLVDEKGNYIPFSLYAYELEKAEG